MLTISPISFPGLGLKMDPAAGFSIGSLTINIYGICIAVGLLLAVLYGCRRAKQFGFKQDDILDGVLCVVPVAIICARLYYCLFKWDLYKENPLSMLYIWEGGLAIYGGIIGAALGVTVFCLVKKIKLPALLDLVALGFLIGQCVGRWGNFFNREAFGAETESFLRMGLFLTPDRGYSYVERFYHPTFFYESMWNLAGFVLLHFLSKRRKYDGQIALGYVAWYGLGRAMIEGLRTDSLYIPGSEVLRVSQLLAAATCFVAVALLLMMSFRKCSPDGLYVNQVVLDEPEEEDEGDSGEEDEDSEEAEEEVSEEASEDTEEEVSEEETEEEIEEKTEEEQEKKPAKKWNIFRKK